jgi:hypothetical protein
MGFERQEAQVGALVPSAVLCVDTGDSLGVRLSAGAGARR